MLNSLLKILTKFAFSLLDGEQSRLASEAKQRTLNILHDALKKKDILLVEDPDKFSHVDKQDSKPIISTDLVKDLISQLQKVTFQGTFLSGRVDCEHQTCEDEIIYLGPEFWKKQEFLDLNSRPRTLIHQVSHLLGYRHSPQENTEKVKETPQQKLYPISANDIDWVFSCTMNHGQTYTNGSYSCCGETSRDTVCEKSTMSFRLRRLYSERAFPLNGKESKYAHEAKKRTLNILHDALKKKDILLVEDPDKFSHLDKEEAKQRTLNFLHDALTEKARLLVDDPDGFVDQKDNSCPLISTDLVRDLISELQKVKFKRNNDPYEEERLIAYVYPNDEPRVIYLCSGFWERNQFLKKISQPKTLIHETSHLLGYKHSMEDNAEKVKLTHQHKLCPVSVYNIEEAFAIYMNHKGTYTDGCYSCCGETSRDTLCEKSAMSDHLRQTFIMKTLAHIGVRTRRQKRAAYESFLELAANRRSTDVTEPNDKRKRTSKIGFQTSL